MATSGVTGQFSMQTAALIEHAFRRCGKLPSTISGELLLAAKSNLALVLTDLVNDGLSLWCIQTTPLPCLIGKMVYALPPGTADVLNVNYRTQTALDGTLTVGVGWAGNMFTEALAPTNVQFSFATAGAPPELYVEYSDDAVTWTYAATYPGQSMSVLAEFLLAFDIDNTASALYWRLRDPTGVALSLASLTFSNAPSEIPMGVLNRDDYSNLPNKTLQTTRPTEYWYDKQIATQLRVWPIPNSTTGQLVVQTHRQIQDVGTLSESIEVPQRWLEYVIDALAYRVGAELPRGELEPGKLEKLEIKAESSKIRAEDGESDGAPFKVQPNLRGYT